jgi:hypothetical protein
MEDAMSNPRLQRLLDDKLPQVGDKPEVSPSDKEDIVQCLKNNGFTDTARVIRGMSLNEIHDWLVNEVYG